MSIPEVFFRETIDLNRFSNAVAKKYAITYNKIIIRAAKKLKQIDNDLIIIHFAWHSIQLKGCISVTSLQEISAYCDVKVIDLFRANKNDEGKPQHWSISTKDLYNTARYHDRILPFKVTKKEAKSFLTKHKGFNKPSLVGLMKDE